MSTSHTSHMNEIAQLVGVTLLEEFYVPGWQCPFRFTERGLERYSSDTSTKTWCSVPSPLLTQILTGEIEIIQKPWNPTMNSLYYYISDMSPDSLIIDSSSVKEKIWRFDFTDYMNYKAGNYFRSKAIALNRASRFMKSLKSYFNDSQNISNTPTKK